MLNKQLMPVATLLMAFENLTAQPLPPGTTSTQVAVTDIARPAVYTVGAFLDENHATQALFAVNDVITGPQQISPNSDYTYSLNLGLAQGNLADPGHAWAVATWFNRDHPSFDSAVLPLGATSW